MSTMQRMTLIGLYNYDNSLFDLLALPEGYDKDTFIDSFLLEHGEKCVLYTDPDFMKFSIGAVSRKWQLELARIYEALSAEYNPIYNYDRYEEIEDHRGKKYDETVSADYTNSRTANLQDKTTNDLTDTNSQTVDSHTEHKVSAFNSSSYEPSDYTTVNDGTHQLKQTGTATINTTGTDKVNTKGTIEDRDGGETENASHEAHIYGNIGVMTATKMTDEVIVQRMQSNLYGIAGRIFANELLIQLY